MWFCGQRRRLRPLAAKLFRPFLHCFLTLFLLALLCHKKRKLAMSFELGVLMRYKTEKQTPRIHSPMFMVVAGAGHSIVWSYDINQ